MEGVDYQHLSTLLWREQELLDLLLFKAEEKQYSPFRILMPVDESSLTAAYSAEKAPVLELTLTVRDDS